MTLFLLCEDRHVINGEDATGARPSRHSLNLAVDVLARVAVFLDVRTIVDLRLLSRHFATVVPGTDSIWATWTQEQLGINGITPPRPLTGTGGSVGAAGGAWYLFVQRHGLHRLAAHLSRTPRGRHQGLDEGAQEDPDATMQNPVASLLETFGQWVTVASQTPERPSDVTFHSSCAACISTLAPPRPMSAKFPQHTCTAGVIICSDDVSAPSLLPFLCDVQSQVLEYLQMAVPRVDVLAQSLQAQAGDGSANLSSLVMFNAAPTTGASPHRMVLLLRMTSESKRRPETVAKLLAMLFDTCSTVQLAGRTADDIIRFLGYYASLLPAVSAAPFSTGANTPSLVFTTAEGPMVSIPHLMHEDTSVGNFCSWILNRTCSVGVARLSHRNLFSLAKPLQCPAWVNPAATVPIPPTAVLKMIEAETKPATPLLPSSPWSLDVLRHICHPQERRMAAFYEDAIRTEFDDHTRRTQDEMGALLPNVPLIPMNPHELVEAHNLYFYATLRKYAYFLPAVCGADTAAAMKLLEVPKRNIGEAFRRFWRRNNDYSRDYCTALFEYTFEPMLTKYCSSPESSPLLHDKRGLKQWFTAASDKICEYEHKAQGLRQFDILSEELSTNVFPPLIHFLQQYAESSPYARAEDGMRAVEDLEHFVRQRTAAYNRLTDGALNKSQHESALYTAAMSNDMGAQISSTAASALKRLADDAEAWEQACLMRIRVLTWTRPGNCLSLGVGAQESSQSGTSAAAVPLSSDAASSLRADDALSVDGSDMVVTNVSHRDGEEDQGPFGDDDDEETRRSGFRGAPRSTDHEKGDDDDDNDNSALLIRAAENREKVIHEALAAELGLKAQASRLASRLPDGSHPLEFDVLTRLTSSSSSSRSENRAAAAFDRIRQAIRGLLD